MNKRTSNCRPAGPSLERPGVAPTMFRYDVFCKEFTLGKTDLNRPLL